MGNSFIYDISIWVIVFVNVGRDLEVSGLTGCVCVSAGSLFMQDSRCWHSSPMHNTSGRDRVAMVCRCHLLSPLMTDMAYVYTA